MPRHGRIVWLAVAFGIAVGKTRAQDDLAPPPKAPVKSTPIPLPADDIDAPPAPLKKSVAKGKSSAAKETIDFPGIDLPSDPPSIKGKQTLPSRSEATTNLKVPASATDVKDLSRPAGDQIAFPIGEEAKKNDSPSVAVSKDPPKAAPRETKTPAPSPIPRDVEPSTIKLSEPVAAQSNPARKTSTLQPVEAPIVGNGPSKEIPAPTSQKSNEPIAASDPPHVRHAPKKTIKVEMAKPTEEVVEKATIIQAAAIDPAPKPQDQYELVQPRLPSYDVVYARRSRRADGDALRVVYESPGQLSEDGVIQAGATAPEGQAPAIESYQVRIWKIDGWETYLELARMEYREESLAQALAKYNRAGYRPGDALPAGQKVRLPPKWVLERSGTTVASRPAPIKSDFNAPPATAVQGQPPGSGIVASSGDRSKPGSLVKNGGALPLPKETAPPETGPVFVVNEKDMTLYKVAKRALGDGAQWKQIYDLNRDRLSSSQAELKVGTRLRMPDGSTIR